MYILFLFKEVRRYILFFFKEVRRYLCILDTNLFVHPLFFQGGKEVLLLGGTEVSIILSINLVVHLLFIKEGGKGVHLLFIYGGTKV